jgi:hypothetical protein
MPDQPVTLSPQASPCPSNTSTTLDDLHQNASECSAPRLPQGAPDDPNPIKDDLTPRQLAAIDLMLAGASDTAIASTLQIIRSTVYRWRAHNPLFRRVLAERLDDRYSAHIDRFLNGLSQSLQALTEQAQHPYAQTSHRAARTILIASRLGQHLYNMANPNRPGAGP